MEPRARAGAGGGRRRRSQPRRARRRAARGAAPVGRAGAAAAPGGRDRRPGCRRDQRLGRAVGVDAARGAAVTPSRRILDTALAAALAGVALLTLVPTGRGWSWGAPVAELHWY